jgi:hypothetical protein
MNKKQYCYECGNPLINGREFDICSKCALANKDHGDAKGHANATRIKKRRKPTDE